MALPLPAATTYKPTMQTAEVVVIGAGLRGLSWAGVLHRRDCDAPGPRGSAITPARLSCRVRQFHWAGAKQPCEFVGVMEGEARRRPAHEVLGAKGDTHRATELAGWATAGVGA